MSNTYIYTETAFHHEGDMNYLKELIDASVKAGVDGIKFQVLTNCNDFISTRHASYASLANFCLRKEQWREVFAYARNRNLDIVLMPLNKDSLILANEFPIKFIDVHSVSFYDIELLTEIRNTGIDVIIGIGGRSLDEIVSINKFFEAQLKILMVGFQAFPSQLSDIKLSRIGKLRRLFPHLTIGYADHSSFDDENAIYSNIYAKLLGANIFEKHITLAEGVERTDFQSAISWERIKEVNQRLKWVDNNILNQDAFDMTTKEIIYRQRQLKCVASEDLKAGHRLTRNDIRLKLISEEDGTFANLDGLIGKTISKDISFDEAFLESLVY